MTEYEILRFIWWALLGILLIGFAVMDGFDLGTAALLPFVARNDMERRIAINTIGPVWEGNQVWFILGGGAIFAAWPALYAASFSGFYLAMFLVLATLILRPGGIQVSQQGRESDLAQFLGLGAVRWRRGALAGVWRGIRESVSGRAFYVRRRSAFPFHYHIVLSAQSIRVAGRPCQSQHDRPARRSLAEPEDGRRGQGARTRGHAYCRAFFRRAVRRCGLITDPYRRLPKSSARLRMTGRRIR